nr:response regulator transcription factor [uncultured Faecalimonas sp.]
MNTEILIIEDDEVIRKELQTLLNGNGYHTSVIEDFCNVTEQVRKLQPHLILLDVKLPQENGFTICAGIRSFSQAPIIFVTSCNTDMDELNSIMLGGDAFITKPYHTAILLAKIAFLLKRAYPGTQNRHFTYEGVSLCLETGTIEADGKQAELTKNELRIMYYLFEHAGTICTRADLIEYLWDNQLYVDDNALSVNIGRIREKLASIGVKDFIKTKHRQGYTL